MYDDHEQYRYPAMPPATSMPPAAPMPPPAPVPPRRRRRRSGARTALLVFVCIVFAAVAGFAGGYYATSVMPVPDAAISAPTGNPPFQPVTPSGSPPGSAAPPASGSDPASPAVSGQDPTKPVIDVTPPPGTPADTVSPPPIVIGSSKPQMTVPEVAAAVKQSVVEIKTEAVVSGGWTGAYVQEGAGSGVIISDDGYIITNDHVISGATNITVRLDDGREYTARLIATDPQTDVAIIKIDDKGLAPAIFGDSEKLVVGETAIAVGNPLGELGGTVTCGIISALDREISIDGNMMTLLQTDAAVNPGNSGGGLFNLRGELIGVVNAKSAGSELEGLGYAIPSNTAVIVAGDLINHGYVRGRVDTGLELIDIQTISAARRYRVEKLGLYIFSSKDDQLKNGDIITAIDGYRITNIYSYNEVIKTRSVGDVVEITVQRGNQSITAAITLREWKP